MKNYIKLIFASFILIAASQAAAQANQPGKYSLRDVINMTVANHPLIKQKKEEWKAAQYRVEQQNSSYLPTVAGKASYTWIAPLPAFAFGGEDLVLAPANNVNFGVFVHQTLYDFGRRDSQVDFASSFLKTISDNEELIKNELANQAVKLYYGILFIDKTIAVKDTQIASLNQHIKITEARIKNGTATDYDLLSSKTRIIEIENDKIELRNEKNKQELYLKELMGIERNKPVSIEGEFELPPTVAQPDSLTLTAFSQRAELKLAEDSKYSAKLNKEMTSLMDKPFLAADFGYGFKNGYEPNIYVLRGNWFLGVNLEVPIFNGFLTKNKIAEADANISLSDKKIDQVKESISTELYQSLSDYNSALKKVNSTLVQIDLANKYLERANLQYARGAGTNLEVLDAQTSLTQARLLNVQAVYRSIVSYYSVKKAAGDRIYDK